MDKETRKLLIRNCPIVVLIHQLPHEVDAVCREIWCETIHKLIEVLAFHDILPPAQAREDLSWSLRIARNGATDPLEDRMRPLLCLAMHAFCYAEGCIELAGGDEPVVVGVEPCNELASFQLRKVRRIYRQCMLKLRSCHNPVFILVPPLDRHLGRVVCVPEFLHQPANQDVKILQGHFPRRDASHCTLEQWLRDPEGVCKLSETEQSASIFADHMP
mmetsp:Transcript_57404/g.126064  ORF Transcript_57404/g.126064 Transcript_57404/m.126064 type:complete len:217 (+) Transcript_57404:730-1380(+)